MHAAHPVSAPPPRLGALTRHDDATIDALLDAAFGANRRERTAYRLRTGLQPIPALSFAVTDEHGGLIGLSQCWPVALEGSADPVSLVLVGPVAVTPGVQGEGIGTRLMLATLAAADAGGCGALVLIGDADYYGRFGFGAFGTGGWTLPGPVERERLLVRLARGVTLPATGLLGPDRSARIAADRG